MCGKRYVVSLFVLFSLFCLEIFSSLSWADSGEVKIILFENHPPFVLDGDPVTLSWKTINAKEVYISGIGNVSLSGSRTLTMTNYPQFRLTAVSADGIAVTKDISLNRPTNANSSSANNSNTSPAFKPVKKPVKRLAPKTMTPIKK